jgi:3-oxoacyl-[acyl-carrier-protein] synthase II
VSVATPREQLTTPDGAPRVVVTGTGMLTALGADVAGTWAGLIAGRSGITTITAFDPARVASRIAGEVPGFDPSVVLDRKEQRRTDRYTQLALVAARQALDEAGLPGRLDGELAERTGILIGTGLGGGITFGEQVAISIEKGADRVSPFFVPMAIPNLAAGQAAIFFGALGPNYAIASACASGGHAVGEAWEIIRRGDAEMMLAGSAEAVITEPLVAGFAAMRALSTRNDDPTAASRPFDRGRDGFVIGEGAGVLVLETLAHARDRGSQPLGEVLGYGATADASHVTLPAPGGVGAIRAVRRALEKARLTVDDVEHVNAHATSTPEGDRTELEMLRGLFGARAGKVNVTAIKSMIGHTLGAAGSIEAIVTLRTLREGVIPPTINLDDPDEAAAGLDLTPNVARERRMRIAVSNSFGFGGQNSALVLRRWDE